MTYAACVGTAIETINVRSIANTRAYTIVMIYANIVQDKRAASKVLRVLHAVAHYAVWGRNPLLQKPLKGCGCHGMPRERARARAHVPQNVRVLRGNPKFLNRTAARFNYIMHSAILRL